MLATGRARPLNRVGLLVAPGMRAFDVAVAQEVFGADRTGRGVPRCDFALVGLARDVVLSDAVTVHPAAGLESLPTFDLVLIPGAEDPLASVDARLVSALKAAHGAGVTLASLCSGAFLLAATGLLDGYEVTTHWRYCGELSGRYPTLRVNPDILYTGSKQLWTSAGVTAGIDLCLHLARTHWGSAPAATIARSMVAPMFRTGGQAQFIPPRAVANTGNPSISRAQLEVLKSLHDGWSVAAMARHAGLAERTFIRHFTAEVGTPPGAWITAQRIDAAKVVLESTDLTIEAVAARAGFGSADSLRKHFSATVRTSPGQYRAAFRKGNLS